MARQQRIVHHTDMVERLAYEGNLVRDLVSEPSDYAGYRAVIEPDDLRARDGLTAQPVATYPAGYDGDDPYAYYAWDHDDRVTVDGLPLSDWLMATVMPPLPVVPAMLAKPSVLDQLPSHAPRHIREDNGDTPTLRFIRRVPHAAREHYRAQLHAEQRRNRHRTRKLLAEAVLGPLPAAWV